MSEFTSYFNNYGQVAPSWAAFMASCAEQDVQALPGYAPEVLAEWTKDDGTPELVEVTANNYPKIYNALKTECEYRGIPLPACYVDRTDNCAWGWARRDVHAIAIEEGLYDLCTEKELRWIVAHEVKHLYQADWETPAESILEEDDCDRAAVQSTGYETARSFFHKGAELKIRDKVPFSPLRGVLLGVHKLLPNLLSEHFPVAVDSRETDLKRLRIAKDKYHRSPAARMKIMRDWEKQGCQPAPDN